MDYVLEELNEALGKKKRNIRFLTEENIALRKKNENLAEKIECLELKIASLCDEIEMHKQSYENLRKKLECLQTPANETNDEGESLKAEREENENV